MGQLGTPGCCRGCREPWADDTSRALASWEHLPEKPLAGVVPAGSPCRGHRSACGFLAEGWKQGTLFYPSQRSPGSPGVAGAHCECPL